jgi:hypothetical protein
VAFHLVVLAQLALKALTYAHPAQPAIMLALQQVQESVTAKIHSLLINLA